MSFFDQFSKVTKDLGNKAQEVTKDLKGKLEEQQAVAKLNSQISDASNLIKSTYTSIGETYYKLHKDDPQCDMADQFQVIADALKTIQDCRDQIKEIKKESTCPSCGAVVSKDAAFCPSCGTKLEKVQQPVNEEEAPQTHTCPVCNAPLSDGDLFCTSCGAPVSEPEETEEEASSDD